MVCNDRDASVEWQAMGDNRAPILGYIIQYNTSFTPDTWENAFDSVPATSTQFNVSLNKLSNFTIFELFKFLFNWILYPELDK